MSAPEVTEELLSALEFRYAVPACCRVCGAPLQVVDSRGMKMACTSDAASPLRGKHEAAGVTQKQALDHYMGSLAYDPPPGDALVLALVAEIRRLREGPGGGKPTMRDVASLAGVSLKTVSRVVSGEPGVTPGTAARVRAAVEELGFRRNEAARVLRYGTRRAPREEGQ